MAAKTPSEIYEAAVESGTVKAAMPVGATVVAGALAGAFIAMGGLFGIAVTSGLDPKAWGTLPALFMGAAFSVGLVLVVVAGAELVTGGVAAVVLAAMRRRTSWLRVGNYVVWATVGALLGALFVAYFLGVKSGILTQPDALKRLTAIAVLKAKTETDWQIFLRGIGCNWLVCLAVWMALGAQDIGGKILAIFFPITAFVAMGFDHVVANMFFLPAAHFAGVGAASWSAILRDWLFAGLGNGVGAVLFVSVAYWYLYGRMTGARAAAPSPVNAAATARHEPVGVGATS